MPLLCPEDTPFHAMQQESVLGLPRNPPSQSQHSVIAKSAILSHYTIAMPESVRALGPPEVAKETTMPTPRLPGASLAAPYITPKQGNSMGTALTDTPATTAPNSPRMWVSLARCPDCSDFQCSPPLCSESGSSTPPRSRPTTLDIPGLTRSKVHPKLSNTALGFYSQRPSKVSPDGRIAQRDVGSKLVIVMVGLPGRSARAPYGEGRMTHANSKR